MHDDISRYATKVKIDPHVSCKNKIYSHSLIKIISIHILYTCTCMYTYVGCTAKSDLNINEFSIIIPRSQLRSQEDEEEEEEKEEIDINKSTPGIKITPTPRMFLYKFEVLSFCHILCQYEYMSAITYIWPSPIFFQIDITEKR